MIAVPAGGGAAAVVVLGKRLVQVLHAGGVQLQQRPAAAQKPSIVLAPLYAVQSDRLAAQDVQPMLILVHQVAV
jgi:hypothetical protein